MAYSLGGKDIEKSLYRDGWRCEWWWLGDEYVPKEWIKDSSRVSAIDGMFWISPDGEKIGVLTDEQIKANEKYFSKKKKRTR